MKKRPVLWFVLSIVTAGLLTAPASAEPTPTPTSAPAPAPTSATAPASPEEATGLRRTRQATLNLGDDPQQWSKAASVGFDLLDVGPWEEHIDALPAGAQALIWAGNTQCSEFQYPWEEFTQHVDRLAAHPRVFGWFISDEPLVAECPEVLGEIQRRADYIRAKAPRQKSFIVAADTAYAQAAPASSHVDYVGINPYPCRPWLQQCDFGLIEREFKKAEAAGIPRAVMVPKYQTFGQDCTGGENGYRLPSERDMITMLLIWHRLLPNPAFEMAYSWGNQPGVSCPTLVDADGTNGRPNLQRIMKLHALWHTFTDGRSLEQTLTSPQS
ncbi:hypothetical protein [Bailinhaonella thermotolerans]|uniref:Uncharacterized protein n=1 Tax=Bailinhaonella thermotolerans TaxID=1070861 RepID=A0A3A4AR12_9ACTN|nr:hypothetical protein [Bailinhaonella thermotolerans]RJL32196.1 hypothetical protein D5H75_17515 [Bailinhaonella thermotolerans]